MNKLLLWSHVHGDHPILLSCSFLTRKATTVDLFSLAPGERKPTLDLILRHRRTRWSGGEVAADSLYDEAVGQARETRSAKEKSRRRDLGNTPPANSIDESGHFPERLAVAVTRRADAIERDLYDDVVDFLDQGATGRETLLGRSVISSWIPLNLFANSPESRYLYFGVLDRGLPAARIADFAAGGRNDPARGAGIDIDVTSRMLVAITKRPSEAPPPWGEVQGAVTRRS